MYPYSLTLSVPDFWKLLAASGLLSPERCDSLASEYALLPGKKQGNQVLALAEWLVAGGEITGYQARLLLSGRPAPLVLGDYLILHRVSNGRFTGFYRAEHRPTGHTVLLQFPSGVVPWDRARWQVNRRLADLRDAYVVRCYEAVEWQKRRFLVFEEVAGQSLRERFNMAGRLPAEQVCRLAVSAARGLAAIHRSGRPHGDVRPENILCSVTGPTRLVMDGEIELRPLNFTLPETAESLRQRADYLAPEFTQAGKTPDMRTDIYALGCTLYEALAGHPPFPGGDLKNKLLRHAREPIRSLASHGVSAEMERVVAYMMAKNPPIRFQSAQALADQLAALSAAVDEASDALAAPAVYEQWLSAPRGAAPSPPAMSEVKRTIEPPVVSEVRPPVAVPPVESVPPACSALPLLASPAGATVPGRHRKSRRPPPKAARHLVPWILAFGSALAVLSGAVYLLDSLPGPGATGVHGRPQAPSALQTTKRPTEDTSESSSGSPSRSALAAARPEILLIDDDGQHLWASPTDGAPLDLSPLPLGGQLFIVVRPAEIMTHAEGAKTIRALGEPFTSAVQQWESASGFSRNEIQQLTLAVYPAEGTVQMVFMVRLPEALAREELLVRWNHPTPDSRLATLYERAPWAFYAGEEPTARTFLMGPVERLRESVQTPSGNRPVPWHAAKLLQQSDSDRHVTILFFPGYLETDGYALWDEPYAVVRQALEWLIGDHVGVGSCSMHWGEEFYFELRLDGHPAEPDGLLPAQLRDRWSQGPDWLEDYLATNEAETYWRRIALRIPSMARFVRQQSRFGAEQGGIVLNCVVPAIAAHNLAGAGVLLARSFSTAPTPLPVKVESPPQSLDELLTRRLSIRLGQESLETALQAIEEEVRVRYRDLPFRFSIRILGNDLQADGITRNQPIRDFAQQDQTLAEILTALVMKANPVTTVRSPSEPAQRLVWAIGTDPAAAPGQAIVITTRQVAEKEYQLPAPFRTRASR